MKKTKLSTHQKRTMQTIIGGLTGAFLAVLLGTPLGLLAVAAICAAGYAFRWRVAITRKPREDSTPNA